MKNIRVIANGESFEAKVFDTMYEFANGLYLNWTKTGNKRKQTFIEKVFLSQFEEFRVDTTDRVMLVNKEYVRVYWKNIKTPCYVLEKALNEPVYKIYRLDKNVISKKKYYQTDIEVYPTKSAANLAICG